MDILPLGDAALVINFQQKINEEINREVMCWADLISRKFGNRLRFISPAYCSLTVGYNQSQLNFLDLKEQILSLDFDRSSLFDNGRVVHVPVCYQGDFAPDLDAFSKMKNISPEEIIALHIGTRYRVYMLGFVPGFVYMGKVDEALYAERMAIPRTRVPAGSVGLAGWQTGIYPSATPGGWHLIGRTPAQMLLRESHPSPFRAGDTVRFYSIEPSEFHKASIQYDA